MATYTTEEVFNGEIIAAITSYPKTIIVLV